MVSLLQRAYNITTVGAYSRSGKPVGIQQDHAKGDGFDSMSVQKVFVLIEIFFSSLGIEYLRDCSTKKLLIDNRASAHRTLNL